MSQIYNIYCDESCHLKNVQIYPFCHFDRSGAAARPTEVPLG